MNKIIFHEKIMTKLVIFFSRVLIADKKLVFCELGAKGLQKLGNQYLELN